MNFGVLMLEAIQDGGWLAGLSNVLQMSGVCIFEIVPGACVTKLLFNSINLHIFPVWYAIPSVVVLRMITGRVTAAVKLLAAYQRSCCGTEGDKYCLPGVQGKIFKTLKLVIFSVDNKSN